MHTHAPNYHVMSIPRPLSKRTALIPLLHHHHIVTSSQSMRVIYRVAKASS